MAPNPKKTTADKGDAKTGDAQAQAAAEAKAKAEAEAKAKAEAEAKAKAEAAAATKAQAEAKAEAEAAAKAKDDLADKIIAGEQVTVICTIAGGRRRAGRRWPGGESKIDASELSDKELEALEEDPLFRVITPGT